MHVDPRRLQLSQMVLEEELKIQRTLRRLHSQQLLVPLRTFLRFSWECLSIFVPVTTRQASVSLGRNVRGQGIMRCSAEGSRAKVLDSPELGGITPCSHQP